jgi:hypothetical protein
MIRLLVKAFAALAHQEVHNEFWTFDNGARDYHESFRARRLPHKKRPHVNKLCLERIRLKATGSKQRFECSHNVADPCSLRKPRDLTEKGRQQSSMCYHRREARSRIHYLVPHLCKDVGAMSDAAH